MTNFGSPPARQATDIIRLIRRRFSNTQTDPPGHLLLKTGFGLNQVVWFSRFTQKPVTRRRSFMEVFCSATIKASAEKIFDLITDDEKKKKWAQGLAETTYPEGRNKQHPVGTKFIQKIKEGHRLTEYNGEILAFEPPRHLSVRMSNKHIDMDMHFNLKPMGQKTQVDFVVEMPRAGLLARTAGKVFGWFTKMILKNQLSALKTMAEEEN
jgi:uncharacterized protein YndB with AHSA1/START domain